MVIIIVTEHQNRQFDIKSFPSPFYIATKSDSVVAFGCYGF